MNLRTSVLFLAMAAAAFGAGDKGSIAGTVISPLGKPWANAPIQAKNTQTAEVTKATSAKDGAYTIPGLAPGSYDITVTIGALKGFEKKGVMVESAKASKFDIQLEESTQLSTLGEDPEFFVANQKRHHPPSGPAPRTFDGKPDFSGVWWTPTVTDAGKPEFLPAAEAIAAQRRAVNNKDSPGARCLPSAVTRLGPLYQFVQSKDFIAVVSDDDSPGFHLVYLDGRKHPEDPNPAWYGHNIAKFEGDTLVIDRVAFDPRVYVDQAGHPHSDKLHVVEKYRRPDLGHLEAEVTVEDPGVLAKPYTIKRTSELALEEINEFICAENNRDVEHLVGK